MNETASVDGRWQFWIDRDGTFTDIVARKPNGARAGVGRVITTELEPNWQALSQTFGADVVLDGVQADIADLTGGKGAPLVIEAAGRDWRQSLHFVATEGTVGFFGLPERLEMTNFPLERLLRSWARLCSTNGSQNESGLSSFATACR